MAIENTLLLKIGGGIVAAGGATTVGIVYRNDIGNLFGNKGGESKNIYWFLAGKKTSSTDTAADQELYTTADGKTTKNYQCKIGDKKYECDIVKNIETTTNGSKKWINTKELFKTSEIKTDLKKETFNAAHSLLLLKIDITNEEEKTLPTNKEFSLILKSDDTKKFADLTTVFVKKNNDLLDNVSFFVSKIKDFGSSSTETTHTTANGETYKCAFADAAKTPADNSLKACSILKFSDSEQTGANAQHTYASLTFVEEEKKTTTSDVLKQHNYYIVKFDSPIASNEYLNKNLIYLKIGTGSPEKIINFDSFIPSFMAEQSTNKKLLLLVD